MFDDLLGVGSEEKARTINASKTVYEDADHDGSRMIFVHFGDGR